MERQKDRELSARRFGSACEKLATGCLEGRYAARHAPNLLLSKEPTLDKYRFCLTIKSESNKQFPLDTKGKNQLGKETLPRYETRRRFLAETGKSFLVRTEEGEGPSVIRNLSRVC